MRQIQVVWSCDQMPYEAIVCTVEYSVLGSRLLLYEHQESFFASSTGDFSFCGDSPIFVAY